MIAERGVMGAQRFKSWTDPLTARVLIALLLAAVPLLAFKTQQPVPYFPDEYAHYDILAHVADGRGAPPRFAEASGATADLFACTDLNKGAPLMCGATGQDPARLPWLGENAATASPPFFYQLQGRVAGVLARIFDTSLLDTLRALSVAWALLLGAAVVAIASRLGAGVGPSVAAGVLASVNPLVLSQSMVVQTDVPGAGLAMVSIAIALSTPARMTSIATANTLAAAAVLVRWTGIIALVALSALEGLRGRGPTRRVGIFAPLLTFVVCVGLVLLDQSQRSGLSSNGLQDAYVRQMWQQNPVLAIVAAWAHIPNTLAYPFTSSSVRPGGSLVDALVGLIVITALVVLIAILRGVWSLPQRPRVLAAVSLGYLASMPVASIVVLIGLGYPLFHQPRYLLPGVLLALAVMATVDRLSRSYQIVVGLLWLVTVFGALLG